MTLLNCRAEVSGQKGKRNKQVYSKLDFALMKVRMVLSTTTAVGYSVYGCHFYYFSHGKEKTEK